MFSKVYSIVHSTLLGKMSVTNEPKAGRQVFLSVEASFASFFGACLLFNIRYSAQYSVQHSIQQLSVQCSAKYNFQEAGVVFFSRIINKVSQSLPPIDTFYCT